MLALIELEDDTCNCGCGLPRALSHSREWNWKVEGVKCYAGQALDIVRRMESDKNQGVKGWDDGIVWTVRAVPVSDSPGSSR